MVFTRESVLPYDYAPHRCIITQPLMSHFRVAVGFISYENKLFLLVHRLANETYFYMKGCAPGLLYETEVKKQRGNGILGSACFEDASKAQFRHIKIQPKTIDLGTRLRVINPINSVVIPWCC